MRKALTWTFSGFFRSLGRALFWLLIIIFLSLILSYNDIKLPNLWSVLDVNANTINMEYYNNGLDYISGAKFYNWTSSTAYSELSNSQTYIEGSDFGYDYSVMTSGSVTNFGSNGISFTPLISNIGLINNSYYSTILYICYENNVNINLKEVYSANTYTATFNNKSNYSKELLSNTISKDTFTSTNPPNYCRAISFIYQLSIDSSVLNIRLSSSGSLGYWYIVGTKTEYIGVANGLTSSQVSNIIDSSISNSDLATANDIQSVNSAIEDLGTDIENMSDAIVDNQNQNTQDIIDNQNANSQAQIESQQVCASYDKTSIKEDGLLNISGNIATNSNWGVTDYIKVQNGRIKVMEQYSYSDGSAYCFYDFNKTKISCYALNTLITDITIPSNVVYMRSSIVKPSNRPQFQVCINGNQATQDTITNDDSSGASSEASSFFDNFTTNTHGLTGIITAPLNAINSLTNQTCTPLVLPLPFVNQDLTLPCMRPIYEEHFSAFMQIYDIITLGIISYWVMVRIFSLVKDFKNPEHDEVEVLDL